MERVPVIQTEHLYVSFQVGELSVKSVCDVNVTIYDGEVLCLLGESGCGKSVFGNSILRLHPDNALVTGKIYYQGRDLTALSDQEFLPLRGAELAWVPQSAASSLNPLITVGNQVDEVYRLHIDNNRKAARKNTLNLFKMLGLPRLPYLADDHPHELSGGMKQRVLVAMGTSAQPKFIVVDEPTKGLDAMRKGEVVNRIAHMKETYGSTMLLITHDVDSLPRRRICRRAADSTPAARSARSNVWTTIRSSKRARILRGVSMLEFDHVTKQYRSGMFGTLLTRAVDDVSFTVGENERLGLLGESGCGKSTIAQLSMRLLKTSKGEIRYNGKNIRNLTKGEMKTYRKNVQIVFQNPQQVFNPRMKLYETIAEPVRLHHLADRGAEEERFIAEYMDLFGLPLELYDRFPQEISGGQAQRIAIMRIVMLKPEIIIADEPTTMLDVSVQAQILELLNEVMDKNNISLMFVSHDLDVVRAMCREIMVIREGKVIETGPTEEIFEHPKNEYTAMLVDSMKDKKEVE